MRAILKVNPHIGPGYGQIILYDIQLDVEPELVIRRLSDGETLGAGGWRKGKTAITPGAWKNEGGNPVIPVGPEIVNSLDPSLEYELELPGTGTCPLIIRELFQSHIVTDDSASQMPPSPRDSLDDVFPEGETVTEEVEATPRATGGADQMEVVSGVAAVSPEEAEPDKPPRRWGCLGFSAFLFAVWVAGGYFLWQGALNAPPSSNSLSIEIIPKSQDSSIVEDKDDKAP